MDNSKHKKKRRRKRSHNQSEYGEHGRQQQQQVEQQQHHIDRQKRHQEALALSQELRKLSSQKRLTECIDLYHSPTYDNLRDAHHGSIVVDCCARCGDVEEAEKIVNEMLQSRKSQKKETVRPNYFWEEYKQFSYKEVPIQAWTALLKGYVHSGILAKADSLFSFLCSTHNARAGDGGNKKRKREGGDKNGPNVRTLNTLLRGCLWTATSFIDAENDTNNAKSMGASKIGLIGGVMTAERAWSLCDGNNIGRDSSSYEYFITILAQSLQCQRSEICLQQMRSEFDNGDVDPTMIESVVVCLVAIARGYALLGKTNEGRRCAEEALRCIDASATNSMGSSASSLVNSDAKKQTTTGGKRSWRDSKNHTNSLDAGRSDERREESNKLFRSHRLSELRSEAESLCSYCSPPSTKQGKQKESHETENGLHVAQLLMTRLIYLSGGGTTCKKNIITTTSSPAKATAEADSLQTQLQWIHSLWHSFGLKEIVQHVRDNKEKNNTALRSIFQQSKELPNIISPNEYDRLRACIVGEDSIIKSDGRIDFTHMFKSSDPQPSKRLHIELGAGSGDWACRQAELNPSENYVTVELRADRVAQTFAKCVLHQIGQKSNAPIENLCCVGAESGSFLNDRVEPCSVDTIYVNHPEPPTQTYSTTGETSEEPSHMLNSQTILSAARCLKTHGQGRLIIVTDNLFYARLICHTVACVEKDSKLAAFPPIEVQDLRLMESSGQSSIHLYEGKPSSSIGHYGKAEGGSSYFDRLWRTGAGKHADMRKRYIIALRTIGGTNIDNGSRGVNSGMAKSKSKSPKPDGGGGGARGGNKPKKRSAEKQRRRNERRLLKKQQLAQSGEKDTDI